MTRGARPCFFSSLRSRRLAAFLSRRLWTKTSSTTPSWSTARQSQCFLPPIIRQTWRVARGSLTPHALPEPYVTLSRHTAPDVRPFPCRRRQCANRCGLARITRANHSLGPPAQPVELVAGPADQESIDAMQSPSQCRLVEMAVVVDPALDVGSEHPRQICQGFVGPVVERPPSDRLPDRLQRLRARRMSAARCTCCF